MTYLTKEKLRTYFSIKLCEQEGWPSLANKHYVIVLNLGKGPDQSRTDLNGFADRYLTAWLPAQRNKSDNVCMLFSTASHKCPDIWVYFLYYHA